MDIGEGVLIETGNGTRQPETRLEMTCDLRKNRYAFDFDTTVSERRCPRKFKPLVSAAQVVQAEEQGSKMRKRV